MNKFKLFAGITAICLLTTGCAENENISQSTSEQSSSVSEMESSSQSDKNPNILSDEKNPLTGEYGFNENAVGKRPVAVMVSNIKAALPQYGIDEADIVYELPVEGGITRLMAIYGGLYKRSGRLFRKKLPILLPSYCLWYGAIYCHWGSDKTIALDTLNYLDIDRFDGNDNSLGYGTVFERDEERAAYYDTEHTGCLRGS